MKLAVTARPSQSKDAHRFGDLPNKRFAVPLSARSKSADPRWTTAFRAELRPKSQQVPSLASRPQSPRSTNPQRIAELAQFMPGESPSNLGGLAGRNRVLRTLEMAEADLLACEQIAVDHGPQFRSNGRILGSDIR